MAKRKQLSQVQKDYKHQRQRLKNYIKRAEKQGYIFPDDILPKEPKKITPASINRLADLHPKDLRKNAEFIIHETGEVVQVKGNKNLVKAAIS